MGLSELSLFKRPPPTDHPQRAKLLRLSVWVVDFAWKNDENPVKPHQIPSTHSMKSQNWKWLRHFQRLRGSRGRLETNRSQPAQTAREDVPKPGWSAPKPWLVDDGPHLMGILVGFFPTQLWGTERWYKMLSVARSWYSTWMMVDDHLNYQTMGIWVDI